MTNATEVLGWTLVHFCWQAAAIALLYRAVDLALFRSRSHIRYAAAMVALFSMLAAAVATLGYEQVRLSRERAAAAVPANVVSTVEMSSSMHAEKSSADVAAGAAHELRQAESIASYLLPVMPWIDAMWLVGVLVLSARTLGGWYMLHRLRSTSLIVVPDAVRAQFARLAARMGIPGPVDLFLSERISSPMAIGAFRYIVLMPISAITHLSAEQIEVVLAHELAHIRRRDYLWNIIQTVVETLFFFHPAVWWVSGSLRRQRELCCDDVALACCDNPVTYATALLRLEEQRRGDLRLAMALDGHQSGLSLRSRILRILGEGEGEAGAARGREIGTLSVAVVLAVLGLFLLLPHQVFAGHTSTAAPVTAAVVGPLEGAHVAPKAAAQPKEITPQPETRVTAAFDRANKSPNAPPAAPLAVAEPKPAAMPQPLAAPAPRPAPKSMPASIPMTAQLHMPELPFAQDANTAKTTTKGSDYIDRMRAAGYDVDLDEMLKMKIQGVTPEFAADMSSFGLGKPTAQQLVELKIFNVSADTVKELEAAGMKPESFHDLVQFQIFKVTPEFVRGMKDAGFSQIPPKKFTELRIHGVTPEFAKSVRQQYPDVTLDQLIRLRIFRIDDAFIASAKQHGFNQLTIDRLVKLRISGLLDEDNQKSEN